MAKHKTIAPKNFYCEIPVAPEDIERFKKGCAHYRMTVTKKSGPVYFTVGTDNIIDLYWLGANIYGSVQANCITQRAF